MKNIQQLYDEREKIIDTLKDVNKHIEEFFAVKLVGSFYKSKNDNLFYFIYEHKNTLVKCIILDIAENTIIKDNILPSEFEMLVESTKEEFVSTLVTITLNIQVKINEVL